MTLQQLESVLPFEWGPILRTACAAITLAFASATHASACAPCEEEKGLAAFERGEHIEAFALLKACEYEPGTSANTFVVLAFLYFDASVSGIESEREREIKDWTLFELAALTGNEDAIVTLAGMFGGGNQIIGFGPEEDIQDCLLDVAADRKTMIREGYYSPDEVQRCLSLSRRANSKSPTNPDD